jgi:hypothetical protein
MKTILWVIVSVSLALGACARVPDSRPDDFGLILDWDNGALPPPYHYSYSITIGPVLVGQFSYQPGYAPENQVEVWNKEFSLENKDLDALYKILAEKGMLRENWATGQPLLGGQGSNLDITASGKDYHIPSVSMLTRSEREKVEVVFEIIRGYVPQSIWDEIAARQAKFEAGFAN